MRYVTCIAALTIHVFEIRKLENTEVFRTDLKQIFEFIKCSSDKKKLRQLVQSDPAYQAMNEEFNREPYSA